MASMRVPTPASNCAPVIQLREAGWRYATTPLISAQRGNIMVSTSASFSRRVGPVGSASPAAADEACVATALSHRCMGGDRL